VEEVVKTYLNSGILELYALGSLTPAEQREVEDMAARYPEVRSELREIEKSMQRYAEEQAVEPPEALKNRVLNSLITNLGDDRNLKSSNHQKEVRTAEAKLVTLNHARSTVFYKYAFAASLILLCLSVAALATVYNSLQRANGQLLTLQSQNQKFSNLVKYQSDVLDVYQNKDYKRVTLKGMPKSPASTLDLAFNPAKKKVMLSTAHMNLPANDKSHQYQLWALVNGKPVDLGVFDAQADSVNNQGMIEMKSIAAADAFAVTLEPRGGSENPTLTEMMVMAKL
jgi:anti-sigma-K factor RskA